MSRRIFGASDKIGISSGGPNNTSDITLFAYIRPIYTSAANMFISHIGTGTDGGHGYGWFIDNACNLNIDIAFVGGGSTSLKVNPKRWNRIALVRRSSDSKWIAFVNGRKQFTGIVTLEPFSPNGYYTIGARTNSSGVVDTPFQGDIAKHTLWSAPLTDGELIKLTRGRYEPENIRRSKIVQYHPLRGSGSSEFAVFAGNTLTVTGTAKAPDPKFGKSMMRKFSRGPNIFTVIS